jgi:hypothetical protein
MIAAQNASAGEPARRDAQVLQAYTFEYLRFTHVQ